MIPINLIKTLLLYNVVHVLLQHNIVTINIKYDVQLGIVFNYIVIEFIKTQKTKKKIRFSIEYLTVCIRIVTKFTLNL